MPNDGQGSMCMGVMSGTSVDGIDVAVVEIHGVPPSLSVKLLHFETVPFEPGVRQAIFRLFRSESSSSEDVCHMNFLLGELFAEASLKAARNAGIDLHSVALISSHGQTIFHSPLPVRICGRMISSTLQIGESAILAERTGVPVISDFRVRDMAAGGQGAPLVPFVDSLLFSLPTTGRIAANIGGIANVTYLPPRCSGQPVLAFDTGPGNMVMDGLVQKMTGGLAVFDRDGQIARTGRIHEAYLEQWLRHPYFSQSLPKTTGRELFGEQCVDQWWMDGQRLAISPEDLVSTATEFTIRTFCQAVRQFVLSEYSVGEIIVGGGGASNPVIMEGIQRELPEQRIVQQMVTGIPSDAKEAVAFAVLGYECMSRRPNNVPAATGASHPVVMGKITWP